MLPTTRYDVYDNDKEKRGPNLVTSVRILLRTRLRAVVALVAFVGLVSVYLLPTVCPRRPSIPGSPLIAGFNYSGQNEWTKEKDAVIGAFQHAWSGYKRYAWGHDELRPISHRGSDWFHLGLTLVDSLDLMLMMGLKDEFDEAREWVRTSIQYHTGESNLFEVTIRVLGGFLSTHALSGDQLFADKAADLGERLMAAFSSGTPIPFASVDLRDKKGIPAGHNGGDSSTAEVTTIQLEFTALSRVTGDPKYAEAADRITQHILSLNRPHGLVPIFIK